MPFTSERFQSLRHLQLNLDDFYRDMGDIAATPNLSLKLKSFPFLVTFDVNYWETKAVDVLCDGAAPSLKKFHFYPAVSLPRGSVKDLVERCPELEDFALREFNFDEMEDIVELRRLKLKQLRLEFGVGSPPTSFPSIFYGQSRLQTVQLYLPGLRNDDEREIRRIVPHECYWNIL